MRSSRAWAPRASSSTPGSMTRAQTISRSSRGRDRPLHVGETRVDDVGRAGQLRVAEAAGLQAEPFELVGRRAHDAELGRVGHRLEHEQVAQPGQQVLGEAPRVVAGLDDRSIAENISAASWAANASTTSSMSDSSLKPRSDAASA